MQSTDPFQDNPTAGAPDSQAAGTADRELKAAKDEVLRVMAEMENLRKRSQRDVDAARKYGIERLLGDLLPVADGLEAGLKAEAADAAKLREGMDMTLRMLAKALEANGLTAVDPLGQPFDPAAHQAMSLVETGQHDPGTVVMVFQKGYVLNDRLVRPAMVAVAKEPPPPEDA